MSQTPTTPTQIYATPKNPLADVIIGAFRIREHHDKHTLACYLAGASVLKTRSGSRGGMSAYTKVAEDLLGRLEDSGLLTRSSGNWYVLNPSATP